MLYKNIKNGISILCCILVLATLSCTREKPEGCDPPPPIQDVELNLRFVYTLNDGFVDKFAQESLHTDILVYDETGKYVMSKKVTIQEMDPATPDGMSTQIILPGGKYTIVAWSNLDENYYSLTNTTALNQMRVSYDESPSTVKQTALFHGMTEAVLVTPYSTANGLIEMTKDVKDIHVVIYEQNPIGNFYEDYKVEITGDNSLYAHDNSIVSPSPSITYLIIDGLTTPWMGPNKEGNQFDFRTMRLVQNENLNLIIKTIGDVVAYEESLIELILLHQNYNTQEDLDRYDDYTLYFEIKGGALVLIKVNDWNVVEGEIDL